MAHLLIPAPGGAPRLVYGWDGTDWRALLVDDEGGLVMSGPYAPRDSSFVTLEAEADLTGETVLGAGVIMAGDIADIPVAATEGRLYFAVDTDTLWRDDGGAWVEMTLTPADHAPTHKDGGGDELDASELAGALGALGEVLTTDGAATSWAAAGAGGLYDAYVCVRDVKASGTDGGTFTLGAWRTRDINDEQADTANICSIAANQITLAAGTYRCLILCPANRVAGHQAQLYNVSDTAVVLVGQSSYCGSAVAVVTMSSVTGRFTLAAEKVLEVRHRCVETKATEGFGAARSFGDEIYTIAEFWREV